MISMKTVGLDAVLKDIEKTKKQARFASAVALTKTAKIGQAAVQKEIEKSFDKPKPFTVKGVYVKPARKTDLQAIIGIKPIAAKYLFHQVARKDRAVKGMERYLRSRRLLPGNKYVVPGPGVKLNRNGNLTRGMVRKILIGAATKGSPYFAKRIGRINGVWLRRGRVLKLVLIFVDKPVYQPQLDFYGVLEKVLDKEIRRQFDMAFDNAMRTAR
ncbi:MAG: hypothetical protein RPU59_07760 [Candidatus Sedimenticola sp. (ex Thyasira tokunagai)]